MPRSRPIPKNSYGWISHRIRRAIDQLLAGLGTPIEKFKHKEEIRFLEAASELLENDFARQAIQDCLSTNTEENIKAIAKAFDEMDYAIETSSLKPFPDAEKESAAYCADILRHHRNYDQVDLKLLAKELLPALSGEGFATLKSIWEQCQNISSYVDDKNPELFVFEAMTEIYFNVVSDFGCAPEWMLELLENKIVAIRPADAPKKPKADKDEEVIDQQILDVFLEEAAEIRDALSPYWEGEASEEGMSEVLRHLHTLKGGARMVGLKALGNYIHQIEQRLEPFKEDFSSCSNQVWRNISEIMAALDSIFEQLAQGYFSIDIDGYLESLETISLSGENFEENYIETKNVERDLVEVFLEEANELIPEIESALEALSENQSTDALDEVKRHLHTLKGGARMVGQKKLGQFVHEFEDKIQEAIQKGEPCTSDIEHFFDLHETFKANIAILDQVLNPVESTSLDKVSKQALSKPNKIIRVTTEDMAHFNSLTSIATLARVRVEENVQDIENTVLDLEKKVGLSHKVLSELEKTLLEDNARITPKARSILKECHDHTNQIGRNNNHLKEVLYRTESLLFEARHAVAELQRGLTNIQMVPFSVVTPRLKKIVEQLCEELKKKIHFESNIMEGDIDRQTLDSLIPVFEHMLRNSIDHGVDTPENRIKNGKDPTGTVLLTVKRSSADTLISFQDDGRGINVEGVKAKAIEKGLLDPSSDLSDEEILRFILTPGFSTSSNITKISGRGVGMDVVNSEIEKMGGKLLIRTEKGKGTCFTIVLPFTQAMNEVFIFNVDGQQYALPAHMVSGIVRIPKDKSIELLKPDSNFIHNQKRYVFRYLGELLQGSVQPGETSVDTVMPVILLKVTDTPLAILVDHIEGARRVVVKTAGPQLSKVDAYSGACVLPNGKAIMVLDAVALEKRVLSERQKADVQHKLIGKKVLIVDDSLTVRKMLGKLLSEQRYHVIQAKDGLEAMKTMESIIPDVVILDIDMPRMNGYEVASAMRAQEKLKQIPVIILSSRNSAIHKEKAQALSVQSVLTKPYDEKTLLREVELWSKGGSQDA